LPRAWGAPQTAFMRITAALLVAMLLAACTAPGSPSTGSGRNVAVATDFDLPVGETVDIESTQLSLRFAHVVADSRCPMNARCIWAGNAKVAVEMGGQTIELDTSERFAQRQSVGEYDVVLVHLEPTPMAGEKAENYVATLRVEARP
jgi:hypothetical protein